MKAGAISCCPPATFAGNSGGSRYRLGSLVFGQQPQRLHDHQGLHPALFRRRGCVNGIKRRRLADCRQQRGFAQIKLGDRLAKIQLGGSLRSVGIVTVVCAVQVPFQHLLRSIAGRDLGCQHALMEAAQGGGRLVPQHQVEDQALGQGGVRIRVLPAFDGVAGGGPEIRLADSQGGVHQALRELIIGNVGAGGV